MKQKDKCPECMPCEGTYKGFCCDCEWYQYYPNCTGEKKLDRPDREKIRDKLGFAMLTGRELFTTGKDVDGNMVFSGYGKDRSVRLIEPLIEEARYEVEERIYNWGNEECIEHPTCETTVLLRRECGECWQALKGD